MIGSRFGGYEIVAALGAGGMGEVYRARDLALDRDVALKVLPALFTADPDRVARFDREARVLASLNHPNIAHVYTVETGGDGRRAIVMELVDGVTLAERLAGGAVPLAEALPLARQIALALEAAHEHGIVHRDLKPANIKIRDDGTVKVLDFGLAKAVEPGPASGVDVLNSPTLTNRATQLGVIVGTAAYMAPEQAKGKLVDRRADIWSFGVVLYELLSGRRPFDGGDVSDTLAAVLTREVDWQALPAGVPARLQSLVADCLVRDPSQRLRDIGDARIALDRVSAEPPRAAVRADRRWVPWVAAAAMGAVLGALTVWLLAARPPRNGDATLRRFAFVRPTAIARLAVSPDGRSLVAYQRDAPAQLRRLDSAPGEWRPLPGTTGGADFFWSPDSRHLGFVQSGALKTVDLVGSKPLTVCDGCVQGNVFRGATWSPDGLIIIFSDASGKPLRSVPAEGGEPRAVTALDAARQETEHLYPSFLPDGRRFLFVARSNTGDHAIMLGSLAGGPPKRIVSAYTKMAYAAGHLLFVRDGALLAQRFDPDRAAVSGDPIVLEKSVLTPTGGSAEFSVSDEGTLVSVPEIGQHYWWVDRNGGLIEPLKLPQDAASARVSPDGLRLAVGLIDPDKGSQDIYVVDRSGGGRARLTFDPEWDLNPVWSPDATRVLFRSQRLQHKNGLYLRATEGAAAETLVVVRDGNLVPEDWSADGRHVLVSERAPGKSWDVMTLSMSGGSNLEPWRATEFDETHPRFSPDGKWVAYQSNESGSVQVYVRSFPDGARWQRVTPAGGTTPVWSRDGKELFYRDQQQIMAVPLQTTPKLDVGTPRIVFSATAEHELNAADFDVDGSGRFLMVLRDRKPESYDASLMLNWPTLIQKNK